jgi:hypothetical protein
MPWLLLTFTLPTKWASQRVEIWRKLQRYGTARNQLRKLTDTCKGAPRTEPPTGEP